MLGCPGADGSGVWLALVKVSMSVKESLVVRWCVAVVLRGGGAVELTLPAVAVGAGVYLVKVAVIFFACSLVENLVARVRYKLMGKQTWTVVGVSVLAFVFCVLGV